MEYNDRYLQAFFAGGEGLEPGLAQFIERERDCLPFAWRAEGRSATLTACRAERGCLLGEQDSAVRLVGEGASLFRLLGGQRVGRAPVQEKGSFHCKVGSPCN